MALGIEAADVALATAGAVNLGLAALLVGVDFRHPVNRAFAVFLTMRGVQNVMQLLDSQPGIVDLADRVTPYFILAVPLAALHFALVYRRVYRPDRSRAQVVRARIAHGLLLAVAIGVELAYMLDHGLFAASVDPALHRDPTTAVGPLYAAVGLNLASYGALAVLFGREYVRQRASPHASSILLIAVGFALSPLHIGLYDLFTQPVALGTAWSGGIVRGAVGTWGYVGLVLAIVLGVQLALARRRASDPAHAAEMGRALAVLAGPPASLLVVLALTPIVPSAAATVHGLFVAIWVLCLPLLVTYALLKYAVFGADLRVRWTLKQSTVAGALTMGFFVTSELLERLLPFEGTAISVMSAAGIAVALQPIRKGAERVTTALMPHARPVEDLARDERSAVYHAQCAVLWADGALTPRDRKVLAVARDRLGLSEREAKAIERRARIEARQDHATVGVNL